MIFKEFKTLVIETLNTLSLLVNHPLNRGRKISALWRWFSWQVRSRLYPEGVIIPFVNNTCLFAKQGMTAVTANIYRGLTEFEFMAFTMHFLRPNDFFVDVGANVGTYSILASSLGARCLSLEPVQETYQYLLKNISLNQFELLIDARNIAAGERKGKVRITTIFDTTNRIVSKDKGLRYQNICLCETDTLDSLAENKRAHLIKIDVEGYEENVIDGSQNRLSQQPPDALIIDLNWFSSTDRNGATLHNKLLGFGFRAFQYLPFERRLVSVFPREGARITLYLHLRHHEEILERLRSASKVKVLGQTF